MKRQLFPYILCLFSIFLVTNYSLEAQNFSPSDKHLRFDFQSFNTNEFLENDNSFVLQKSLKASISSLQNRTYFYYSINNLNKGGISSYRGLSYNTNKNNTTISSTNLSLALIPSDLFGQGIFYGFALTIILLNLVCFFIFEEKLYLTFSFSAASLTAVLFYAENLLSLVGINNITPNQIMQSTLLLIAIGIASLFSSNYLSTKEYFPKLKKLTIPLFGIATILLATIWLNKNTFLLNFLNVLIFSILSIYFVVGVLLFSSKKYAKLFVIATFIPLLFSIDLFVLRPLAIDFLFTKIIYLKIAVFFEILILSYAIMYRMKEIKEEIDLKQTEMRIYLKRQDVMSRNQVEKLIEDVYLENLIMQYDLNGLEIKLLQYISEGKTNVKIAKKLKLSEPEVVDYTKELYHKLEISEHIQEDYRLVESQPDYIYN